jgi:hypothetical protein
MAQKSKNKTRLYCLMFLLIKILPGQEYNYPSWFLYAPRGAVTAVGYASKSYYPENAIETACEQARENLARYASVRILGEEGLIIQGDQFYYSGNNFREEIDSLLFEYYKSATVYLDTSVIGDLCLVFVSDRSLSYEESLLSSENLTSWIHELPKSSDFIYAMGIARLYFHEISSWLEAERDARIQLALTLCAEVKSHTRMYNQSFREVSLSKVDQVLQDIQIVARARTNDIFYILVKMKNNR